MLLILTRLNSRLNYFIQVFDSVNQEFIVNGFLDAVVSPCNLIFFFHFGATGSRNSYLIFNRAVFGQYFIAQSPGLHSQIDNKREAIPICYSRDFTLILSYEDFPAVLAFYSLMWLDICHGFGSDRLLYRN